jgi:uncharacterized membrane protein YphA (DoxX/SURF4 family)
MMNRIQRAYAWFLRAANACQSPLLLAIRLYWGWQLWRTGMGKLSHVPKVTDYFTSLGVPRRPSLPISSACWKWRRYFVGAGAGFPGDPSTAG